MGGFGSGSRSNKKDNILLPKARRSKMQLDGLLLRSGGYSTWWWSIKAEECAYLQDLASDSRTDKAGV